MLEITRERFGACEAELRGLVGAHWAEAGVEGGTLKLDWDFYHALDEEGNLQVVAVRDAGVMMGYAWIVLSDHPHTGKKVGSVDAYYLAPHIRRARTPLRLMQEIEATMRDMGAQEAYIGVSPRVEQQLTLLDQMGYKPAYFHKEL